MERITYHRRGLRLIRFLQSDLDAYIEADRVEAQRLRTCRVGSDP